ncbi:MAG: 2-oxoglutarate dehydrogenase E1 component [Caldilineaceae bacterium]|nr:2-oxoglutarate dehydrogenase E1 component [Caldilineaceae bacterium]
MTTSIPTALANFYGPNAGYVLELYERFQKDPTAVDAATRAFFEEWTPPPSPVPVYVNGGAASSAPVGAAAVELHKAVAVANLAQSIREYGHLAAQLDPLGSKPPDDPSLHLDYHGLSEADLRALPASLVGGPVGERTETAWDAIGELRTIYSSYIGYDYDHLRIPEVRTWLRSAAEADWFGPDQMPIDEEALLARLTQVESFEQFLQSNFPGKTRFSIEGLDMLVPMLDVILAQAGQTGIHEVLIGMAHRGRLNVLAHILAKPYEMLLLEFKDPVNSASQTRLSQLGWTGDVKYHAGASRMLPGSDMFDLTVRMAPNPSHLEHVNPVVEGMARAAGAFVDQPGPPRQEQFVSLPIQIHGDAAFSGQGIVAETLNFTRLAGYSTGGTIHMIANNQVGFTTGPHQTRSTLYASDLAKGFKIPIVHVNADDPVACIRAARLAIGYRNHFKRDFFIDLIGYRRYGHNEGDEPRFTQPKMYAIVDELPTVCQLWAQRLVDEGKIDADKPQQLRQEQTERLQEALASLPADVVAEPEIKPPPPGAARKVKTAVALAELRTLHQNLLTVPPDFQVHPRLQRVRKRSENALENADDTTVDWGSAEQLALGSILADGTAIRMTGEDVKRGTFSHRHAALFDAATGAEYVPLHHLPEAKAAFEIHNSPLTEAAAIGFEYGYNIERPERLVIWEAQYGDFFNTAQAVIDEFVTSGFAKWDQTPSLVLLLPHGYEGQGPDHSSARLERFLQSAAEINMRIAYPTTAAQYFHLLRRQAALLVTDPLPLIVMTPKSLLRHPLAASTPRQLAEGRWQPVIDDPEVVSGRRARADIRRLILCSGKIYVDLVSSERRTSAAETDTKAAETAIVRVEQLYPFPAYELEPLFASYPNLQELVWVQEEPRNMGAWSAVKPQVNFITQERYPLRYIGRPRRASPAEGSVSWHKMEQDEIVESAFGGGGEE